MAGTTARPPRARTSDDAASPRDRTTDVAASPQARTSDGAGSPRARSSDRAGSPRARTIRTAAARLFREKGFEATSMRDIGEAVGMEAPSLYNHFASKNALLASMLIGTMEALVDQLRLDIERAAPEPVAQLSAGIRTYVVFHEHLLDEAGIADSERRSLSRADATRLLDLRDDLSRVFRDIIERGSREGAFRVDDASIATLCVLSICARLPVWYRPDGPLTLDSIAGLLEGFVLRGLGASPGPALPGSRKRHSHGAL